MATKAIATKKTRKTTKGYKKKSPRRPRRNAPWTIKRAKAQGLDIALFIDLDQITTKQKKSLQKFLDETGFEIIAISQSHQGPGPHDE